jgi:3-oxoacyl-[acyl-carrier-protein] synthase III
MFTDPLATARVYHANLQVLSDLTAIAMEMARAVKDQVLADAAAGKLVLEDDHLGLLFSRIGRTIRQTVMLSIRLTDGEIKHLEAAAAEPRPDRSPSDDLPKDKPEPRPRGERAERLDDPDIDDEMGDRTPAEIIADICRDLDLPEDQFVWAEARPGETASALSIRMLAERGIDIVAIHQRAVARAEREFAARRDAAAARDPP